MAEELSMIGFVVLGIFIAFMWINIPISISMGLASAIGLLLLDIPGVLLPQKIVAGVQSWTLLAVPFYILAAQIMNYGGVAERLLEFAEDLVGWMKGGLAHANVLASMIFAGISGAAVADASGLGLVEVKVMSDAGYDKRFAVGVTAASCMLGPIIPPSIMLIIYGHVAELSIATLWFAGIVPGLLTGLLLMGYIYWEVARKRMESPDPKPFSPTRAWKSFCRNIFVVFLPILLLWTILSGVATPTETGVIACLYTFILSVVFGGKSFIKKIPEVLVAAAKSSGLIMFIIATATVFVWIMSTEQTAIILSETLLSLTDNKYLLLLIINVFLLIIGAFLEQIPAMLIIVPLMSPIPMELGINPIQFGIMVVFNLMIGMITPPMGMALYIMGAITDVPMRDIIIYSMRFFFVLFFALLLITYIPFISTFIPNLLGMSMF
jgi:tripartite ATP-independent transporter DctM subunit